MLKSEVQEGKTQNVEKLNFPRPMIHSKDLNFSCVENSMVSEILQQICRDIVATLRLTVLGTPDTIAGSCWRDTQAANGGRL